MQIFFNLIMDVNKAKSSYSKNSLFFMRPILRIFYYIKFSILIYLYLRRTKIENILYSYIALLSIFMKNADKTSELNDFNMTDIFKISAKYKIDIDSGDEDIIGYIYTFYNFDEFGEISDINFKLTENKNDDQISLIIEIHDGTTNYSFDYINTKNPLYIYYKIEIDKYIKSCISKCLKELINQHILSI